MAITYNEPVLRKRGTTTQVNAYSGPVGELVIDTTKSTVVVQTNTPGGSPLAKESVTLKAGTGITINGGTSASLASNEITIASKGVINSGSTGSNSYGPSNGTILTNGGTFSIPVITVTDGVITSVGNSQVTLPTIATGGGTPDLTGYVTTSALQGTLSNYLTAASASSTYATKAELQSSQGAYWCIYMAPNGNDSNSGLTASSPVFSAFRVHELLQNAKGIGNKFSTMDGGSVHATSFVNVIMAAGTYDWSNIEHSGFYFEGGPNVFLIPQGVVTIKRGTDENGNAQIFWRQQHCTVLIGGQNGSYTDETGTIKESAANGSINSDGKLYLTDATLFSHRPITCYSVNAVNSEFRILGVSPDALSTSGYQSTRRTGALTVNDEIYLGDGSRFECTKYTKLNVTNALRIYNSIVSIAIAPYSTTNGSLTEAQALANCTVGRITIDGCSRFVADYLTINYLNKQFNYAVASEKKAYFEVNALLKITCGVGSNTLNDDGSTHTRGVFACNHDAWIVFRTLRLSLTSAVQSMDYFIHGTRKYNLVAYGASSFNGINYTPGINISSADANKITRKITPLDTNGGSIFTLKTEGTLTANSDSNLVIPGIN